MSEIRVVSDAGPRVTAPIVRVMLALKRHEQPRGSEILALRRARELGLVVPIGGSTASPDAWGLTVTGDLVLQAYAIGRSRWGAR
jgi:hypothetical protein